MAGLEFSLNVYGVSYLFTYRLANGGFQELKLRGLKSISVVYYYTEFQVCFLLRCENPDKSNFSTKSIYSTSIKDKI